MCSLIITQAPEAYIARPCAAFHVVNPCKPNDLPEMGGLPNVPKLGGSCWVYHVIIQYPQHVWAIQVHTCHLGSPKLDPVLVLKPVSHGDPPMTWMDGEKMLKHWMVKEADIEKRAQTLQHWRFLALGLLHGEVETIVL